MLILNPTASPAIDFGALLTGLGGGLALFLYGMRKMTEALKTVAGPGMKTVLGRLTANRFTAATAGAIITSVIQSSSVTTVLVVGFTSAGLLSLSQSIGVIIGANVGTTITAQIIAFQIYEYGLLMVALGFLAELTGRSERVKQWGSALMGLGLIFFGMELMSNSTGSLRTWPPFIEAIQGMRHPLLGIAAGMLFTAIVQSSSATTGIVIVLASQGLIPLESGIGLILGANVGTCVTAMVSAFGRPREAVQAALAHVIFNVGGVVLWMFFIPQLADLARDVSPAAEGVGSVAQLAADAPRQIANAHTIFNVVNALLFIWFTGPLARLVERVVPPPQPHQGVQPLYLDPLFLEQPAMALDQVRRELVRLAELDRRMMESALEVVTRGSRDEIEALSRADDEVDALHGEIVTYLGQLSLRDLVEPQPDQLHELLGVANYLENFGDVIVNNLLDAAEQRWRHGVAISAATLAALRPIHEEVRRAFEHMIAALTTRDRSAAQQVMDGKATVVALADQATGHLAKRLVAGEPNRLATFKVETDAIENLKRLYSLTRRVARLILAGPEIESER